MERTKVQSDDKDIYIECPYCDNWEQLGIDDPRHRLHTVPIIEWYEDEKGKNEVSLHECIQCKNKFEVEWDYSNPIT